MVCVNKCFVVREHIFAVLDGKRNNVACVFNFASHVVIFSMNGLSINNVSNCHSMNTSKVPDWFVLKCVLNKHCHTSSFHIDIRL